MERPSLEMVLQAVDAMYRGEKPDSEKASQWLTELHSSVSINYWCSHCFNIKEIPVMLKGLCLGNSRSVASAKER